MSAAHVSYAFTEVAAIYPITPSSQMADYTDIWASEGRKNMFGQTVKLVEMQSEGGAAGAVHGAILTGALSTTYTASQGLLLMIPNMYKIAAELMPAVIHVSARTLSSHALSIFGDQGDVMACRQTGFAFLASTNPQEIMDLGAVAHLAAIKGSLPFLHFFDGFRTSHEMQKVAVWSNEDLEEMLDKEALERFRSRANLPAHPVLRGSAQNGDIFFQAREACNTVYDNLTGVVVECMDAVNKKIGTDYKPFNYYGAPDATSVLVAMGSVCDTIEEVVDYLNGRGEKVGLIKVRLYRPFSPSHMLDVLPATVKTIGVLDRTKEPGGLGEPLYMDVATVFKGRNDVNIVGGRYGLASKDTTPRDIIAAFRNIQSDAPINNFTISIVDDITNLSLPIPDENPNTTPEGITSCKFWGAGADGTVGANHNTIKIIGDNTDMHVQAYFQYDSRKSGGVTRSHLRFGNSPIKSTYYVTNQADFVACHNPSYLERFDLVQEIKPGGTFLASTHWDVDELDKRLPAAAKKYIADNNIQFYTCDAISIAKELGLGTRTNTILQSAFFKLSGILPLDDAVRYMKEAILETYGNKGEAVVNMNYAAVDKGRDSLVKIEVPDSWKNPAPDAAVEIAQRGTQELRDYVENVMMPMNLMRGDELPVSAFVDTEGGSLIPSGTSAFEKRTINAEAPLWVCDNCIQCNFCSYVCPHSIHRPFALTDEEVAAAPEGMCVIPMTGKGNEEYKYAISTSVRDCTGCGVCVNVCPGKKGVKALEMTPIDDMVSRQKYFDYCEANVTLKETGFAKNTVKGSQFLRPLLEFPGACAGCGETPYAKLITQLFGDRMLIANATGCSSIWGGQSPTTPYCKNEKGQGPAWANSLFEDNAEFGFGMALAMNQRREGLANTVRSLIAVEYCCAKIKEAGQAWLDAMDDGEASKAASDALIAACEYGTDVDDMTGTEYEEYWDAENKWCKCEACAAAREILNRKDLLVKPSVWVFGGDGWAYDIGYGGLDHVLAAGENINVLVFDTEVYSNTGGQASKSTPTGAIAQFAAAGMPIKKKDLAQIAMVYDYVYVAQVAMGSNYQQTLNAIIEAESYDGPSIVIAYSPCIAHGIRQGMGKMIDEAKRAVEAGYWTTFRYDPRLRLQGKNPLQIDSKPPTGDYQDFIKGEVRYSSLARSHPERAKELFESSEKEAKARYDLLVAQKEMLEPK